MASPAGSPGQSQSSRNPPDRPPGSKGPAIKKIGKYEIQKKIGAGGMGAVYLALDPILNRTCALKVLPHEKAGNPTLVKRFKAEAQNAANLRHENIVTVYEAGEADGYLYIALEYVEGTDVGKLVEQRGTIPLKRSLSIVRQVAKALEHAYEQGIVHRDIKPGNLLVRRDGVVKLADMGLARSLDDNTDTSITRAGTTVGTVDYMSPEQARDSRAADIRSDIYSLGCTWYFMLTGEPPFPAGSLTNKLRAHAETPLPDPRSINPSVSEAVFGVMRRMAEKKAGKRYQNPSELLADLDAVSLTSDIVTDTILADVTEAEEGPAAGRKGKARTIESLDESDEAPVVERKTRGRKVDESDETPNLSRKAAARNGDSSEEAAPAFMPPPRKEKPKPAEKPKRNSAALFYAIVSLILMGLAAAIISLVKEYGGTADTSQSDRMGNPFAARNEAGKAAGRAPDGGHAIEAAESGPAPGAVPTAEDQSRATTNVVEGAAPPAAGPGSPVVDSGPSRTRIAAGEGGQITSTTVTPGSKGHKAVTEQSAARTRAELSFLPGWAGKPRPTEGLPVLLVQAGASGDNRFPTLNAALEAVPETGAAIQLAGNGPFPLHAAKISGKTRIVMEPRDPTDAASAPLVVLLPPESGTAASFLELTDTALELRKVHVAIDASGFSSDGDEAMLSSQGGDVFLQDCSLSTRGAATSAFAAIRVAGKSSRPDAKSDPRIHVLLEHTLIRGNNLTAVAIGSEHVDLAVRNCLFWSGAAPALRFSPMARSDADSARDLRLASTTICAKRTAVEIAGDASQPVPTSVSLLNSLVTAPAGSTGPALLRMEGWSQNQQKTALGKFINWRSSDTLYAGWTTLVALDPGDIAAVTTAAQWHSAWKDKSAADKAQFFTDPWPARPISDIGQARLDAFVPQSIGKQLVKTADGGWPGCSPEELNAANLDFVDIVDAAAVRPEIPRGMYGFAARETIRIDAKDDVGKVLEHRRLQNGTEIIISGSGHKQSSPIVIENAWVRIQFEQGEGPPLVLTPRGADSGQKREAFITVINGGLELVGCVFTTPAAGSHAVPKWFIQVVDGDLAMWRCRLQGPLSGATQNVGLIRWVRTTGAPPVRMFTGNYTGYCTLQDCYLLGAGTLIDADIARRALIFRNSIAVGRDDLIALNLGSTDTQIGGVVDAHFSTFSAADRVFQVRGADLGGPATLPLALFADRCVFAPPLRSGQQKPTPTLLAYSGPVLEQQQVVWWENHCGYAPEITNFLRSDTEPATVSGQDFDKVWVGQWGKDQVIEPLRGVKGVVLKGDLPTKPDERAKLEPSDFELHAAAKGATWADRKGPIGAYVASMNLPPIRGAEKAPKPKTKPARAPAGSAPQGGF